MATAVNEHAVAFIKDRQSRLEALNQLIATTPRPSDPRPRESDATLRRTIARLRSGRVWPTDPAGDPDAVADELQKELDYRVLHKLIVEELGSLGKSLSTEIEATTDGLMRQIMAVFHAAKQMPEAQDPNSDVSEFIRLVDRGRRANSGRPRRK